jgi:hypothetical protein
MKTLQALFGASKSGVVKRSSLLSSPNVAEMLQSYGYHEKVIDHYENPRNVGSLDKNDPMVGTGIVGAPACGDVMKLQIKVCTCYILYIIIFVIIILVKK